MFRRKTKLPPAQNRKLETVIMSSPAGKLMIYQDTFGYQILTPSKTNKKKKRKPKTPSNMAMLTGNSFTCATLCLVNNKHDLRVMSHFDAGMDCFTAIIQIISHLLNERIISKIDFDTIEIFKSPFSWPGTVRQIAGTLEFLGFEPKIYKYPLFNCLGYTKTGQLVKIKLHSIDGAKNSLERRAIYLTAQQQRTIFCMNTGTFFEGGYYTIYPEVQIIDVGKTYYVVNIPIPNDFDDMILRDGLHHASVYVDTNECDAGRYLSILGSGPGRLTRELVHWTQEVALSVSEIVSNGRKNHR